MLVETRTVIDLQNIAQDRARKDEIRRFEIAPGATGPLRISAEVCTEGVTGPPGGACMVFFNIEYAQGPVFWDTFLYPDPGSTPWRLLSCEVRSRGEVRAVEMHIRFHARGRLLLRNLQIEAIEPWIDDAECVVAIFGDSTDMTNYLPTPLRLGTRLEELLRDRFADRRVDVHCLAEGGEYLRRLLESGRLERELQALPRCDIAMIRYGLNDRSQKVAPEDFKRQLHAACATIRERFPAARIVLSTTIPPHSADYDAQTMAVAEELNLPLIRLDDYIRRRSAAGESDWHDQPGSRIGHHREANPPGNADGLSGDTHPNALGAQMIAEFYFDQLEPIVAAILMMAAGTR
jgi:lysophospholipase L1-like esterase